MNILRYPHRLSYTASMPREIHFFQWTLAACRIEYSSNDSEYQYATAAYAADAYYYFPALIPFFFLLTKYNTTLSISISVTSLWVSYMCMASSFCLFFDFRSLSNLTASLGALWRVFISNSKCLFWGGLVPPSVSLLLTFNILWLASIIFCMATSVGSWIEKTKPKGSYIENVRMITTRLPPKGEAVVAYHMVNIEGEYENTIISSVFLFGMTHIWRI